MAKTSPAMRDLTGQVFGLLTVIEFSHRESRKGRGSAIPFWLCRCACGTEKKIRGNDLTQGRISSCRCLQRLGAKTRFTTHGKSRTPEHKVWMGIIKRCQNPKAKNFVNYGGRGIKVCPRWLGRDGFANFLADMGPRPEELPEVDRIDNDGDYSPENCRWADRRTQARNRRGNHLITFDGRTQTLTAWAEETGLTRSALDARLDRGWSAERALTTPRLRPCRSGRCPRARTP